MLPAARHSTSARATPSCHAPGLRRFQWTQVPWSGCSCIAMLIPWRNMLPTRWPRLEASERPAGCPAAWVLAAALRAWALQTSVAPGVSWEHRWGPRCATRGWWGTASGSWLAATARMRSGEPEEAGWAGLASRAAGPHDAAAASEDLRARRGQASCILWTAYGAAQLAGCAPCRALSCSLPAPFASRPAAGCAAPPAGATAACTRPAQACSGRPCPVQSGKLAPCTAELASHSPGASAALSCAGQAADLGGPAAELSRARLQSVWHAAVLQSQFCACCGA